MKDADDFPIHSYEYLRSLSIDFARAEASVPSGIAAILSELASQGPLLQETPEPDTRRQDFVPRPPSEEAGFQDRVDQLIRAYRVFGHLAAKLDPLGGSRPIPPELTLEYYGLGPSDLDRVVSTRTIYPHQSLTLREVVTHMQNTYCGSIGVQFMHIDDLETKTWLQVRMEATENRVKLSPELQRRIMTRLTDAVLFEEFIHAKFPGAKSFSLEGAETLIPLLDMTLEKAGEHLIDDVVIGMAHRGRLNVLANILCKPIRLIFQEFEDAITGEEGHSGDVKYHLGFSSVWRSASGHDVHVSLTFNPSHLEFVGPVVLGRVRARQDRFRDHDRRRSMAILIHGDAAFAGEGIVQETLNLSELPGFRTGGTLHIVVNNQIGFTTPPEQARSGTYATDVAKMLQVPIFHVNGEDPEAVVHVVNLVMDFKKRYARDVVIDMYCYRRYGHSEGDEPSFTQPLLYRAIEKHRGVVESYLEHLLRQGFMTREMVQEIATRRRQQLEAELGAARASVSLSLQKPKGIWAGYSGGAEDGQAEPPTGVSAEKLSKILEKLTEVPEGFTLHPRLRRFMDQRRQMARRERPVDWAAAEALAFATLAVEGHRVRLTGQDSERGTFSHRHAVLHDYENGRTYMPLAHVAEDQAPIEIVNSPLSEAGVSGFQYGYSLDAPDSLVIWEAQFGDFVNVAQVYVDQFVASAETKWNRLSGLVMLLPHGLEGQGPEHSSARMERFLALCANDNMQVAIPTTAAQYFHLLRRQVERRWRKPLVIFTPKGLLRHPRVAASLDELQDGMFKRLLVHGTGERPRKVVVTCGKLGVELLDAMESRGVHDIALVRLELLYPLAPQELVDTIARLGDVPEVVLAQEEPLNMGPGPYMARRFMPVLGQRWRVERVGRPESSTPGTGSLAVHRAEQKALLDRILT